MIERERERERECKRGGIGIYRMKHQGSRPKNREWGMEHGAWSMEHGAESMAYQPPAPNTAAACRCLCVSVSSDNLEYSNTRTLKLLQGYLILILMPMSIPVLMSVRVQFVSLES